MKFRKVRKLYYASVVSAGCLCLLIGIVGKASPQILTGLNLLAFSALTRVIEGYGS
jgi:hypothetical protein